MLWLLREQGFLQNVGFQPTGGLMDYGKNMIPVYTQT